tara:strand:- start:276 stop:1361 length:1086 start_codon:yes stop_codon:yes gene_type:complete
MKSFDKFRYGIPSLREMAVGGDSSSIKKKYRKLSGDNNSDERNETPSDFFKNPEKGNPGRQAPKIGKPQKLTPGIQGVVKRNKARFRAFAKSEPGRASGRAIKGAAKEVLNLKLDKERTDTAQGGMGTALRGMTAVGQAAVSGAINAPAERADEPKRKTLGGKLLAKGFKRFQDKTRIGSTLRTTQGQKITASDRKQEYDEPKELQQDKEEEEKKQQPKENKFRTITKRLGVREPDRYSAEVAGTNKPTKTETKPDINPRTGEPYQRDDEEIGMAPPLRQNKNKPGEVVKQASQQRNKTENKTENKTAKTGTVKGKRRNIANPKYYDTDEKTGKKTFNQQRYDADKNAVSTKKGGGRPKKK